MSGDEPTPKPACVELVFDAPISTAARDQISRVVAGFDLADAVAGRVAVLSGGASNANYLVTTRDHRRLVLRIASRTGERLGLDRWRGVTAHAAIAAAGLAPRIVAATLPAGHLLTEFVDGPLLDATMIREPGMLDRVAGTLRACHQAATIRGGFSVFHDQRSYTTLARSEGLTLPADIDHLNAIATRAEMVFAEAAIPDRLCHNDLQLPNFIRRSDGFVLLDWEYAGMGNLYFDLGATAVNAALDAGEVQRLAAAYFDDPDPTHNARVKLMMFMSALREATWAIVAAPVLGLDWDYQAWADTYYDRCRAGVDNGLVAAALEAAV
jgi:thiamine kinase-like enzyme